MNMLHTVFRMNNISGIHNTKTVLNHVIYSKDYVCALFISTVHKMDINVSKQRRILCNVTDIRVKLRILHFIKGFTLFFKMMIKVELMET